MNLQTKPLNCGAPTSMIERTLTAPKRKIISYITATHQRQSLWRA